MFIIVTAFFLLFVLHTFSELLVHSVTSHHFNGNYWVVWVVFFMSICALSIITALLMCLYCQYSLYILSVLYMQMDRKVYNYIINKHNFQSVSPSTLSQKVHFIRIQRNTTASLAQSIEKFQNKINY